jgi:hypothetical protein
MGVTSLRNTGSLRQIFTNNPQVEDIVYIFCLIERVSIGDKYITF